MSKKFLFSVLFSLCTGGSFFPIRPSLTTVSPETVEFAFDMHEVLVTNSAMGVATAVMRHGGAELFPLLGRLTYDYTAYFFTGNVGKTQQLTYELKKLGAGGAGGSGYVQVLNGYKPGLGDTVISIMRSHYPIEGMTELIKELHDLGYTLRIATNEGEVLFQDKKNQFPELFDYFSEGKTVDYSTAQPWIKKPHLDYFTQYHQQFNPDRSKTIIFIDDQQKNITAARNAGMVGIVFKDHYQLRSELIALGIPLKTVQAPAPKKGAFKQKARKNT
jgi:HAD superfamily hydrolase (TIGR01509 family)